MASSAQLAITRIVSGASEFVKPAGSPPIALTECSLFPLMMGKNKVVVYCQLGFFKILRSGQYCIHSSPPHTIHNAPSYCPLLSVGRRHTDLLFI